MNSIDLIQIAKNTISAEIEELEALKNRIDENFNKAVNTIHKAKGKLIVVGIGKSAHIGNKIVATLNSTGTASQFLHAAEAIHGDLGVIQKDDVVLCISNSGNSPEIVNLLPFLKKYSSALIGMTGNMKSKLAEFSEITLNTHVSKEACPNQLAPTTSTTVQLALGDALAVCLMELNQFKKEDFAKFHPGGALGKQTAKVEQFLKKGRKVLYTGTPCQVAGLNHCLHKKYDNLFTIDVACHGVPSPMLWKRYRNEVKERYLEGEDFTYINFRHQDNEWRGYKLKMQSENHSFAVNRGKNLYLRPFFDGLSIREACYNCSCKEGRNHSDITIADFWGLEHILPEMENPGGVCLININSDKGEQFFPYSKVHFKQASLSEAMKYNEGLHAATKRHAYRDKFFQHINSATSVINELERMFKPTKKEKLRELYWQARGLLSKLYHLIK